jgi:uncharacterized protein YraI
LNEAEALSNAGRWEEALGVLGQIRSTDASYAAGQVRDLRIGCCSKLARQAEQDVDIERAASWWNCVLSEAPNDASATSGQRLAQAYLRGQAASDRGDMAGAIAAWQSIYDETPNYADVANRLYAAHLAWGDQLCKAQDDSDVGAGRAQYAAARAIQPASLEVANRLISCQVATATPIPLPCSGAIAAGATANVRAGPGAAYLVLGSLEAGTPITITGHSPDNAWVRISVGDGREGWVDSTALQEPAVAQQVPLLATPQWPSSVVVAHASADFASEQGTRNWLYLVSSAPGSLSFTEMPWDGDKWYRFSDDPNYSNQMRLSVNGGHPDSFHDVAREWVSSYEGTLHITGPAQKEPGDGRGGNGVEVQIVQNQAVVWDHYLGPYDTTGTQFDVRVPVHTGDEFYFVINALGDDQSDNTIFDPLIELEHEDGDADLAESPWPNTPAPAPMVAAPPLSCYQARLRHYEPKKGCCAEVAGLVYNLQKQATAPSGTAVHIEGPPANQQYVREFGVDPGGGGYQITALSVDRYTIWLVGSNVSSDQFPIRYTDMANIRELVDFYQVPCP